MWMVIRLVTPMLPHAFHPSHSSHLLISGCESKRSSSDCVPSRRDDYSQAVIYSQTQIVNNVRTIRDGVDIKGFLFFGWDSAAAR